MIQSPRGDKMSIGENIQLYRKKCGLSQKELAEKLSCSTGTVQQYELNKREPKFKIVCDIAEILDIAPYQIYGDDIPDPTETRFSDACAWLENAGFEVQPPDEDDGLQQYYINTFQFGTVRKMDKIDIINTVELCVQEANEIRDEIAIGKIAKILLEKNN